MTLDWIPDRRDIIWIDWNPQAGREMRDLHPMLVLSPRAFNERSGLVIGLPMTTSESNEGNPFAVKVQGPRGVCSYILCHQPKTFDWRARSSKAHPWKQVPPEILAAACRVLNQIVALA